MSAAKRQRKKLNTKATDNITKKEETQMPMLNKKSLPSSGKQINETKCPDENCGKNDEERSRRKRDGRKSTTGWKKKRSKTVHGN